MLTELHQKPGRSLSDRSSAVGTLAEIVASLKEAITPFTEPLFNLFYQGIGDSEPQVQSNAAFGIGLLIEHSKQDLSAQYGTVLQALHPMFNIPPDSPSSKITALDNAAGAVARIVVRNTAAIPLDQVLPILFGALPLKQDFLENRPVFRAIFHLFRTHTGVLGPYIDQLLPVFAHVLDPSKEEQLGDETRAELLSLVGALNAEDPAKIQNAGLAAYV